MRSLTSTIILSAVTILLLAQCKTKNPDFSKTKLETEIDTVSYYLGVYWYRGVSSSVGELELNYDAVGKGLSDEKNQVENIPTQQEMMEFLNKYFSTKMEAKVIADNKEIYECNLKFLAENKKKRWSNFHG